MKSFHNSMNQLIKKLLDKIEILLNLELIKFFIVGGLSTIIDWSTFYLIGIVFGIHYILSLLIAYTFGAITNYSLNKIFTFKNKSKKIALQFITFFSLALISLFISILIMFTFVEIFNLHEMVSRIITTFIVFIINFFMHKFITFNKKIFK